MNKFKYFIDLCKDDCDPINHKFLETNNKRDAIKEAKRLANINAGNPDFKDHAYRVWWNRRADDGRMVFEVRVPSE